MIHARRLVAQRCLYGIDRNPMAVDLAKMSLWLSTLARDHPLTFVDHAFRHGDSLVGLSRRQIEAFHWLPDTEPFQAGFEVMRVREHVTRGGGATASRIREAGEEVSDRDLHDSLARRAQRNRRGSALRRPRPRRILRRGKAEAARMQSASSSPPQSRKARPSATSPGWKSNATPTLPSPPSTGSSSSPKSSTARTRASMRSSETPRSRGKNAVAAGNVAELPRLAQGAPRREPRQRGPRGPLLPARLQSRCGIGGALGLIATNTIAQGDTRSSGLRWICEHGGEIYRATKRVKWPGEAAVVVSVLHIAKGGYSGTKMLDGANVDTITAFLFHRGGHADPVRLQANDGKSFQGSIVLGMGFTFDDTDKKGVASPLAEMHRLVEADPHNREAIFPYIGGEEVNTSPTHSHHRYVINFRDYPLRREPSSVSWAEMGEEKREECLRTGRVPHDYPDPVAADWPELLAIIQQRVKPGRLAQKDRGANGQVVAIHSTETGAPRGNCRPGSHTRDFAIRPDRSIFVPARWSSV